MRIEVLCTGDELLTGLTTDTNSPYFMGQLFDVGEQVAWAQTVGDRRADIARALREVSARADAVLVSGGLGPTADDLTLEAAAEAAGVRLVEDARTLVRLRERFARRGLELTPNNLKQALIPEQSEAVDNPAGSAPMVVQRIGRCTLFYVPGVPREYRALVDREVIPRLRRMLEEQPNRVFRAARLLKTVELAESHLDARVAPLAQDFPQVTFGFRTHAPENHLKLLAESDTQEKADALLARCEKACREILGTHVFGADDDDFSTAVGQMLRARGQTLAAAESCTGGALAELVTRAPGASDYFIGSAVVYAERMKTRWAGLPAETIARHGVVSAEVANALAEGARTSAEATWGIGITGFAGPGGGTERDPVGTVYLALSGPGGPQVEVERRNFGHDRERVRSFAAYASLGMLRRRILGAHR